MTDRRRINGPGGNTVPPVFEADESIVPRRTRAANGIRAQCKLTHLVFKLTVQISHE